jgi:acyl-CoA dehydrogenase
VESGAFGLAWTLGLHSDVSAPTVASFHHGAGHEALLRDAAGGRRLIAVAGLSGGVQMTRDAGRWRLDGVAHAVPGAPLADHFLVLSTADGGGPRIAAVPSARVTIEESATLLGASETGSGEVIFDGVELEEDNLLDAGAAERLVTSAALLVGGIAVAAARFCIDQAVAYVNERSVFGRPVALFGNTREQIAAVQSELLTVSGYHSTLLSVPADHTVDKAQCFALARTAVTVFEKCADLGLQLHGGYGYMREYPISHAYAAARYFRLVVDALPDVTETVARDAGLVEKSGDTRVGR